MPIVDPSLDTQNYHGTLDLPPSARRVLKASPRVFEVDSLEQLHHIARQFPEVRNKRGELLGVLTQPNGGRLTTFNMARGVDMSRVGNAITVGDDRESDMRRFNEVHGIDFSGVREYVQAELSQSELVFFVVCYEDKKTLQTMYIAYIARAADAAIVLAAAELQGVLTFAELKDKKIENVVFVETSFREEFCRDQLQAAVHIEVDGSNELYTNMCYSGPQKKGPMGTCIAASFKRKMSPVKHCSAHWRDLTPIPELRERLKLLCPDGQLGWMHEAISGGSKSEIWLALHRLMGANIELARWGVRRGGGYYDPASLRAETGCKRINWNLAETKELVSHPCIDDIGLSSIVDNWMYMSDAERKRWFVRLDHINGPSDNPALQARYQHPWSRGHFLNMRLGPHGIRSWDRLNDNSRVFDDKSQVPNVELGSVRLVVNSYGIRVPAGDPFSIVSVLDPATYLTWWACSPQLAETPSFTVDSSQEFPNEGAGTMAKFNPGTNAQLIEQRIGEMEQTHCVTGFPLYLLLPVGWVGNWYFGYNAPQAACQLVCHNLQYFVDGTDLKDSAHPLLGRHPGQALGLYDGTNKLPDEVFDLAKQADFGTEGVTRGVARILPWFENLIPKRMLKHPNKRCRESGQAVLDGATLAERRAIWGLK